MRFPFALFPFFLKLALICTVGSRYRQFWDSHRGQLLRIAGECANVVLTTKLMLLVGGEASGWIAAFISATVAAESVRLATQKGQMLISAGWQLLPHRTVARRLLLILSTRSSHGRLGRAFLRYSQYYALSDVERMDYLLSILRQKVVADETTSRRLAYLHGFLIVPQHHGLRGGRVRDVARGYVYIHRGWTADPWLLIGQALRRSPWIFDPRCLRRPFHYYTESNPLMTRFVLNNIRLSPPYALYQFGHETKVATTVVLFTLLRWFGMCWEPFVSEDGAHPFDAFPGSLIRCLTGKPYSNPMTPLWSVNDTLFDIERRLEAGERLSPAQIAADYTFPLEYVQACLWLQLQAEPTTLPGINMPDLVK